MSTTEMLGLKTRLKPAMDHLVNGGNPWIIAGAHLYRLSGEGNPTGMMVYTKYRLVDGVGLFSVRHPFSYNDTIRSIIENGDNLGHLTSPKYKVIDDDPAWIEWQEYVS